MDVETKKEFAKLNEIVSGTHLLLTNHLAYEKGLNLNERVETIEEKADIRNDKTKEKLETKASWKGLYLAVTLITIIFGVVIAAIKM